MQKEQIIMGRHHIWSNLGICSIDCFNNDIYDFNPTMQFIIGSIHVKVTIISLIGAHLV